MPEWITFLTFKHSVEAHMIKTRLESEGIDVFLKNEHMAQVLPYVSEPAGPIKLQVREGDFERAASLLKASGYLKQEKRGFRKSALIKGIDLFTSRIPGIKNIPLQLRAILVAAILLVIIALIVSLLTLPPSV